MSRSLVVGVDIGSQSVKAGLFDSESSPLAEASQAIPVHRRAGDEVDQDPEDFYRAATATIAVCVAKAGCNRGDVAAVGTAGQMAGVLGVGADGKAVTPYDSWLDSRCRAELERIETEMGDEVTALTGCPPMVDHAPKIAWWRKERPDAYARVVKFLVPSAFVAGRLCDIPAAESFIDWTHLHFTGMAEAEAARWSPALVEGVGTDVCRLPRIVAPTDRVGTLSPVAARDCGLLAGTPVAAGLGDTAAGALGAGLVQAGQVLDTAGTASVLSIGTPGFRPDSTGTLLAMRGAIAGQWISLSYLAGGDLLSWLPGVLGASSLEVLMKEAASAPPGRALFVPHLGGRILPADASVQGGWVGLDLSHRRGDLVRSLLEAVAYEYAAFLERALELFPGLHPTEVRVIGGGSHNRFWNEVKASVLGLAYARLRRENFSCWGAALVAAKAVGAVDDLAGAARRASEESEKTAPDLGLREVYSRRRGDYQALVEVLSSQKKEEARG